MIGFNASLRTYQSQSNINNFKVELAINNHTILCLRSQPNLLETFHTSNGHLRMQSVADSLNNPRTKCIRNILNKISCKIVRPERHRTLHSGFPLLYLLNISQWDKIIHVQWLQHRNIDVCPLTRSLCSMVSQSLTRASGIQVPLLCRGR